MGIKNSDIMESIEGICNAVNPKLYTQEELDKATQAEREACASVCEAMLFEKWTDADRQKLCAEAIRKRGE